MNKLVTNSQCNTQLNIPTIQIPIENNRTSFPSPAVYIEWLSEFLSKGDDVLYVHHSHKTTGIYQYWDLVEQELKEKFPTRTVTRFDTLDCGAGAALFVYLADIYLRTHTIQETVEYLTECRKKSQSLWLLENLDIVKASGRMTEDKEVKGIPIVTFDAEGITDIADSAPTRHEALIKIKESGIPATIICYTEQTMEEALSLFSADTKVFMPINKSLTLNCGENTLIIAGLKEAV